MNHIPEGQGLWNNYPNPFSQTTTIQYSLPQNNYVTLMIYDFCGRKNETLVNRIQKAGNYRVIFNKGHLPDGAYIYRLHAGRKVDSEVNSKEIY